MAGSFSNYAENKVLDHLVGKTSFTMPTVWVALVTTDATDASTGETLVEPATEDTAYARKSTAGSDWDAASGGATANAAAITFATATGEGWGTIIGFALVDSATVGEGNVLAWGELGVDKTISAGDTASFAIGDLDVTLD
ncbi:MAG: hypothetical protein Q8M92_03815 [Candidatus Subteraquimicrobiales bacterium]|nr:hypothetical protein [Candidatus Subteraquimicrobiales bacterium]